jgi:hypothetical protein
MIIGSLKWLYDFTVVFYLTPGVKYSFRVAFNTVSLNENEIRF